MRLLKYPVSTKHNDYKVIVYDKYVTCGIISYNVEVQIPHKSLFRKFKTVYELSLWKDKFEKLYNYNYVVYAKDAVLQYEDKIKEKLDRELTIINNLNAWDNWDGY